jgi:RNA polymerase sigma-70 factor (ECF subfamily)
MAERGQVLEPEPLSVGPAGFTTTHWTVVLSAADQANAAGQRALEELCRTYWYPLYAYIRRSGYDPHDAQDLTQGFFARLLSRNDLAGVHPDKGRFRSFLLASLKHFLADERDKATALKRGGRAILLSLDEATAEQRYQLEPRDELSPERIYDRRWALTALERARSALETEFNQAEKGDLFGHLKSYLSGEKQAESYAQIAARLGKSTDAVRCAVQRLRRRYAELIRAEIACTVASPNEVEAEIRHLLSNVAA